MSWITAIWSFLIGACAAMAVPHLLIWIWQRRVERLVFLILIAAVIADLSNDLVLIRSSSLEQFADAARWRQLPIFVLWVALVVFVRLYFGTGRWWIGLTACIVRFACLVINFALPPNLYFREMSALGSGRLLGETVAVPIGVPSPWSHLTEISSIALVAFVVDASISLWRRGELRARRRAIIIGGSIILYEVLAAAVGMLVHAEHVPAVAYVVSLPFVVVLAAMAFELSYDLFAARLIEQKLEVSEASLRESKERFRIAADAAPVLIWMSGTDKLCTFFNKAWLEFTGRTMDQELGYGWAEGVHRDDLPGCHDAYEQAFDDRKPFSIQYRLRRRDGEFRWITDNGVPRHDATGRFVGYIGACVDITDLLAKEKALHASEDRVALAAEAAHLGVWEVDAATYEVWASDKIRLLFQLEEGPVTYEAFQQRVHPDDRDRRDALIKRAIKERGSYEAEFRVLLPDGTVRWIAGRARCMRDADGKSDRLVGVSMDVTNRKQAEQLFKLATEASPSGILMVDAKGVIILVNAHVENLFGYSRDEMIGKAVEVLVPEQIWKQHTADRIAYVAAPVARTMGAGRELFGRRRDGTEFPVEIGLNPVDTPEGVIVLATVVDISARKAAEEEARQRREQIELLSRVSLLGEMTASIAHELSQPLSAIVCNASAGQRFIDQGKSEPQRLRDILVDVAADGRRAHEVLQNIRNTIKKGAAVRQRMDLNQVVESVTHLMQPNAAAHFCEVQTSLQPDLPVFEGDPLQIQQVLINLVSNAFDAMREVPVIRRKVQISTENGNGTIRISVRDRGRGVSEEARQRLFEQFFTTKKEGLGMGLAIVRSIIEAHGGRISVENVNDGGARFYFTLPVGKPVPK